MQEYYIKGKQGPAALVLAALRRSGTRPAHLPPPLWLRRTATAGGVPRGAARVTPGGYLLTPRIKFFQKRLWGGVDKIEKM